MDLTIYFEKIVRSFSRYHKYTLGSELRDKSREIVGLIIRANWAAEKLLLRHLLETPEHHRVGVINRDHFNESSGASCQSEN